MRWSSSSDPAEASTIGRPQARAQQLLPGEDVERQAAIVSVVAVEKAPFLVAVQPVVGGVEIEHDALGLARLRLNVEIGQQTVHRARVENDLLVTRISILALVPRQYTPASPRIPRLFALNPAHHLRR